MSRPPLVGLRHVAVRVRDLPAALRFWVDVMGYAIEWQPDADNVYLSSGTDNLALHRTEAGTADVSPAGDAQILDHIGIAVPSAPDVDAWAARLVAHGFAPQSMPKAHRDGSRSLYVVTPGGIVLQIIHHAPLGGVG